MPSINGGRVPAVEVLVDTPFVKELVKKGEVDELKGAMEQGIHEGCQTFDHALFTLYRDGKIGLEDAIANADSANNLRLKIKLAGMSLEEESSTNGDGGDLPKKHLNGSDGPKAAPFRIRTF